MIEFNPYDPSTIANPYPVYETLRRDAPIAWCEAMNSWTLARYDDLREVLRDAKRFSSDRTQGNAARAGDRGLYLGRNVLNADPPDHTRLRRLVVREFTPRATNAWGDRVRATVDSLLAELEPGSAFDVMAGLASPLPVRVIAEMLGVPREDQALFKRWSDDVVTPVLPSTPEAEARRRMQSRLDLAQYFRDAIAAARSRSDRGENLINSLVAARDEGDQLSEDELLSFLVLLLLAGNETTTNLIGNGVLALARNPEQFQLLREQPDLVPRAVEELLRYDGPVQNTSRVVTEPLTLLGVDLAPGDTVMTLLASANRDETRFPDAAQLQIDREVSDHLAFGTYIHICLGAPLARLEGQATFTALAKRFPMLELAIPERELRYRPAFTLRGLESLPIGVPVRTPDLTAAQ